MGSGIWRAKGLTARTCNDKPDMSFQVPELDDASVRRAVYSVAPLQGRNYVVMEVKGNLLKDERAALLSKFSALSFKKTACVIVGEPTPEFKKRSHQLTLQQKQQASD